MTGALRIRARPTGPEPPAVTEAKAMDSWIERLVKLVPAEIVATYLAGRGYAADFVGWWPFVCLLLLLIVRIQATRTSTSAPQWAAISISAISFVIWVFAVGGQFVTFSLSQNHASLLVLVWTTVVPALYKGN